MAEEEEHKSIFWFAKEVFIRLALIAIVILLFLLFGKKMLEEYMTGF